MEQCFEYTLPFLSYLIFVIVCDCGLMEVKDYNDSLSTSLSRSIFKSSLAGGKKESS